MPGRSQERRSGLRVRAAAKALAAGSTDNSPTGPIRVWIVGATGFRQSHREVSGLELLWRKLRPLSSGSICVVTPQAWNDDAVAMADYIARNSNGRSRVLFYGYSYGVGNYFTRLAPALQALGIDVDMAVFCDGIRRFRFLKILSLRWFRPIFSIHVPGNVREVYAFTQSEDPLLRGHDVVADNPAATAIHMVPQRGYDHCSIDEGRSFHLTVLTEAKNLISAHA